MKNRGFTLLELLGVIVILALLTTLVFPSILNTIKKSSNQTDKLSMDLISNAADIYIENNPNYFKKRNGSKFIIDMNELMEDGNLPSNIRISDIDNIEEKCVQVIYTNNSYSYELKDKDTCEYFIALPEEYQQVEYIESTGTQHIDTEYIPDNRTEIEVVASGISRKSFSVSTGTWFFGAREGYLNRGFGSYYNPTDMKIYYAFGDIMPNTSYSSLYDSIKTIKANATGLYIDRKQIVNVSSSDFVTPVSLVLFGLNNNGTVISHTSYNIHSCQIYDNGQLVRNFIPCYRKSDGEIGMYDLVEDKFYTNLGTGTFEKGRDI